MDFDTTIFVVIKCKIIAYINIKKTCDKYELSDITDTFSFNFSTADIWVRSRIVSGREGGGGSLRGFGLNQTNSMSFFPTFNIHIENSRFGGGGVWGSKPPDPCWNHHCTVYILRLLSIIK
jgi:hypothetical protein